MGNRVVNRVYAPILARARSSGGLDARMKRTIDLLWDHFKKPLHEPQLAEAQAHDHPSISWVGFYTKTGKDGSGPEEMVLGYCRDKPACSPIGLHGVCGRCWRDKLPVLVDDVATLGKDYIACDPKDKSELCVPLLNDDGTCWGVLDADSFEAAAFNERDVQGMTMLLRRMGLTSKTYGEDETLRL
ncbi:MAG: GAF domain-containing protein [Planctomycetota bacterium]